MSNMTGESMLNMTGENNVLTKHMCACVFVNLSGRRYCCSLFYSYMAVECISPNSKFLYYIEPEESAWLGVTPGASPIFLLLLDF